jgi:hypothetical protein
LGRIGHDTLATLLGAATGRLTSVLATWLTYGTQVRAQWLEQEALRRRDLHKEFIEVAARCYVHALQHEDRMRILSSAKVVEIAERFARKIIDTYSEPNKRFVDLRR